MNIPSIVTDWHHYQPVLNKDSFPSQLFYVACLIEVTDLQTFIAQ